MDRRNSRIKIAFEEVTAELREDLYLAKVAQKLDRDDAKTYSHDEAWKCV